LLASPPTINSHEQDEDEEDQHDNDDEDDDCEHDDVSVGDKGEEEHEKEDKKLEISTAIDNNNESVKIGDEDDKIEQALIIKTQEKVVIKEAPVAAEKIIYVPPPKIFYKNRDILNLGSNVYTDRKFVNFTVLPENNVICFFQNRSQYHRIGNPHERFDPLEKCSHCEFSSPILDNLQPSKVAKNPITTSLLMFLKNNPMDSYNNTMPNAAPITAPSPAVLAGNIINSSNNNINANLNNINSNINFNASMQQLNNNSQSNMINKQRMYGGGNGSFSAYQTNYQQQQQYQNNGYYNNGNNGFNQQVNSFNNGNGVNANNNAANNGTTFALLNLMNSRNIAGAFQAMNNNNNNNNNTNTNNSRFFGNNLNHNNNNNNNYGLYKQF
jgi:hypothetical protein